MIINSISKILIKDASTPKQIVRLAIDSAKNTVLGSVKAEKAVGKMYSRTKFPQFYTEEQLMFSTKTQPHMYISDLFVDREARKQGIGKQLVFEIIKESQKLGCEGRVVLLAGCNEASPLPFYKKLGFLTPDKKLNDMLDKTIKEGTQFDKNIQSFMLLPKKIIAKILKLK